MAKIIESKNRIKDSIESKNTTEFFQKSCRDFEAFLQKNKPKITSFHPYFEDAFWEMVLNGGKRFRPQLLLAVVTACSKEMTTNAFDVCLAIECLHTYSLIHDDLPSMDNAHLRRGAATLHCKYNECAAILVGDGLNTYAFYLLSIARLAPDVRVALIETLSENGGISGMVLGQVLDCHFENTRLDREKVDFIHTHKTARLIAASLKMGGQISGLNLVQQQVLYDFGLSLGLFFQVRDDIIDYTQDSAKSGKTTQNDTHKNSYVNLLGLEGALDAKNAMGRELKASLDSIESSFGKDIVNNLNVLLESYLQD